MTARDLARLVTAFFVRHLAVEHNASPHITKAYRDAHTAARSGISPHTIRHTKAMHLLQAGIPLITIKDFLGLRT